MTRNDLVSAAAAELAAAGIENPRLEARVIYEHVFSPGAPLSPLGREGRDEGVPMSSPDPEVAGTSTPPHPGPLPRRGRGDDLAQHFRALVARRVAREPLAYVLGRKEFWSLDFDVGPGALVPRPETETLIEQALAAFPNRDAPFRILDLGTGSGCLLVTALTLYPNATGTGLDASAEALGWARRNAERHGVADRARFLLGGWEAASGAAYDLIVANPPYLTEAELKAASPELHHEPGRALAAGPDGLEAYRALAPLITRILAPAGQAFLEIGAGQAPKVAKILEDAGLEIASVSPDLSGIPRCVAARGRSGAADGL